MRKINIFRQLDATTAIKTLSRFCHLPIFPVQALWLTILKINDLVKVALLLRSSFFSFVLALSLCSEINGQPGKIVAINVHVLLFIFALNVVISIWKSHCAICCCFVFAYTFVMWSLSSNWMALANATVDRLWLKKISIETTQHHFCTTNFNGCT